MEARSCSSAAATAKRACSAPPPVRLMDASGHIAGVIAAARDITDPKRMEQQLIQTERLAAMGQMIAGVAHELNNPLTAVLGVTELLRDSTHDDSARRQLEIAHTPGSPRRSDRAEPAVVFAPAAAAQDLPAPERTDPAQPAASRTFPAHQSASRWILSAVPDLPPVLGDTSQLTQVFLNLIANAEQAIREIRDHGTLRIRVSRAGRMHRGHFSG